MGKEKAGFLTPKAISNRIKAKGLQKLRWYCQMCQKQCRDENGFKCHTMSESHQRQLLLVADTPHKYIDSFSKEFSDTFLLLLRRRFGTKRVHCNVVYQEYISDRHHTHMNSTKWTTLTEYIKWLGREGHCVVDETDKGWFVQYIDRSPEAIMRQESLKKMAKAEKNEKEREEKWIEKMVERGAKEMENYQNDKEVDPKLQELVRTEEDEKITFKIPVVPKMKSTTTLAKNNILQASVDKKQAELDEFETSSVSSRSSSRGSEKRKLSALEQIKELEERKKIKLNTKDHWLAEGIVVKIISKKSGEEFYNEKGYVVEVHDKYKATVRHLMSNKKLLFDQEDLRTVLPAIGKQVLVVNGAYRGEKATLKSIEESEYSCTIIIDTGHYRNRVVPGVDYGHICKVHQT